MTKRDPLYHARLVTPHLNSHKRNLTAIADTAFFSLRLKLRKQISERRLPEDKRKSNTVAIRKIKSVMLLASARKHRFNPHFNKVPARKDPGSYIPAKRNSAKERRRQSGEGPGRDGEGRGRAAG